MWEIPTFHYNWATDKNVDFTRRIALVTLNLMYLKCWDVIIYGIKQSTCIMGNVS